MIIVTANVSDATVVARSSLVITIDAVTIAGADDAERQKLNDDATSDVLKDLHVSYCVGQNSASGLARRFGKSRREAPRSQN